MKQLPIGIQDFSKLREYEFLYVDKTELIYRLLNTGAYLFLSRPRQGGPVASASPCWLPP